MASASLVLQRVRIARPGQPARPGSVAIADHRIVWIGPGEPPSGMVPAGARRIDCEGGFLVPGFFDAHCHPLAFGAALSAADCTPRAAPGIADVRRQIALWAAANPDTTYVRAFGYDELLLRESRHPDRHDLDAAVPDRPAVLTHGSGHALVLNTAALRKAGISESTDEPPGGTIDREAESGMPSGILFEMAEMVAGRLGRPSRAEVRRYAMAASEVFVRSGVTTVTDAGYSNDLSTFELWASLASDRAFAPGVVVMRSAGARIPPAALAELPERVRPGPVKIVLTRSGRDFIPDPASLADVAVDAVANGLGIAVHAIEAEAVLAVCEAFELARARLGRDASPALFRIEHAAEATTEVCRAIARAGASVVTQPGFISARGDRYLAAMSAGKPGGAGAANTVGATGSSAPGACDQEDLYPVRRLLDQGIPVRFGSDAPYGPASPIDAICGAVERASASGHEVGAGQAISIAAALGVAYDWPALRAGAPADLAVLNGDPQETPVARLRALETRLTIIGGEVVWAS